jgi:hypothetical protein
MTREEIRRLWWNEPFQPIQLELTDGRTLTIQSNEHFSINPVTGRIAYADKIENFDLIDLAQIKSYRLLAPITPQTQVG